MNEEARWRQRMQEELEKEEMEEEEEETCACILYYAEHRKHIAIIYQALPTLLACICWVMSVT